VEMRYHKWLHEWFHKGLPNGFRVGIRFPVPKRLCPDTGVTDGFINPYSTQVHLQSPAYARDKKTAPQRGRSKDGTELVHFETGHSEE
jgi:hypothetical protein